MRERRQAYLAFQSLLTAILLLFFLFQRQEIDAWGWKFTLLSGASLGLLALLAGAPDRRLRELAAQSGLLFGDAFLTSLTLHWTQNPRSDLYLAYFIIILGAALTRKLAQCFIVAAVASMFYVLSVWTPGAALPHDSGFWLRLPLLWVIAFLAALLSQDAQQAQREIELVLHDQIFQREKLASLGHMAAEVAHRIKGPLTSILVTAEVMQAREKALASELGEIRSEALRCRDILKNLLSIGRIEETSFQSMDLCEPIRSAINSARPHLAQRKIRLRLNGLLRPAHILGDRPLLHEAIFAVLQNAVDAMPGGGRLELRLRAVDKRPLWSKPGEEFGFFDLAVADTGCGIDPKILHRIFDPFFTTKSGGSGLGLPGAQRILHIHNGSIEASSEGPGKGARFLLSVPRFEE